LLIIAILSVLNIKWHKTKEKVGFSDTSEIVVTKKRGNIDIQIKHDETGKGTMTVIYKDETGKETKVELPYGKTNSENKQ
jgi:hypothetical protein